MEEGRERLGDLFSGIMLPGGSQRKGGKRPLGKEKAPGRFLLAFRGKLAGAGEKEKKDIVYFQVRGGGKNKRGTPREKKKAMRQREAARDLGEKSSRSWPDNPGETRARGKHGKGGKEREKPGREP